MKIRPTVPNDVSSLQHVVTKTGLFSAEMLPDMLGRFLADNRGEERWLSREEDGAVIGFCYAAQEKLTEGTWNMLAIAVLPGCQGSGTGKAIVTHLENDLRNDGHRVLIVETSGTDGFAGTRAFYHSIGYTEEARIREFWAPGDDKIVFWKAL